MNKEEILSLNKQDNQRFDEREKNNIINACNKAYRIGRIICAVIIVTDAIISKKINYSTWSIFLIMSSTYLFYRYKCNQKKYQLLASIIYAIIGVVFYIYYLLSIIK